MAAGFLLTRSVKGLVTLDIGYVERSTTASSTQQVLFYRELAAILANPLPLNLRHVDMRGVLVEIGKHTGLRFRVPEHPYASVKAPFFYGLAAGYQATDSLARVVAVADAPVGAGICDDFRSHYAVDIEVMGPDGDPDTRLPILAGVPLPLPTGGEEMGIYAFPEEGTQVVVCFAYGLPHKPYIQTILPYGLSMPSLPKGDQVWQHSEACQQRVDADCNCLRQTDGKILDEAIEREVEAMGNTERFESYTRTVDDHSTESVEGIKKLEALGALKLLSGGSASLAAVDDLHQATGRDLNLVVGQKHNATVGGDMEERIQGCARAWRRSASDLWRPRSGWDPRR